MGWTIKQQEELHKKHFEIDEDEFDVESYLEENSHSAYDEQGWTCEVYNIGFDRGKREGYKELLEEFNNNFMDLDLNMGSEEILDTLQEWITQERRRLYN